MNNMTQKQELVYGFILICKDKNDYCPSVRDIAYIIGLNSTATVQGNLKALERKGYIKRNGLGAISITKETES